MTRHRRRATIIWIVKNRMPPSFTEQEAMMIAKMLKEFLTLHGMPALPRAVAHAQAHDRTVVQEFYSFPKST